MKKRKTIIITLTEQCNLNCSYCYEHNKSSRNMPLETVKRIISDEMQQEPAKYDSYVFSLFGGEPFLVFDKIKEIVAWMREQNFKQKYVFFASTNGTLVHGAVQSWLLQNFDLFKIGLSLDGDRATHNSCRCNSFDDIDLDFYKEHYAKQGVKMTVTPRTLSHLYDGVVFCHDIGLYTDCSLATGLDWSGVENASILEQELDRLIEFYMSHLGLRACSMLGRSVIRVADRGAEREIHCGAGQSMCAYDVNGVRYPCQYFMPLAIGAEHSATFLRMGTDEFAAMHNTLADACKLCPVRAICNLCIGFNYASTGNPYSIDASLCTLTKVIIRKRAALRKKLLETNALHLDEAQTQRLVESIRIIENM